MNPLFAMIYRWQLDNAGLEGFGSDEDDDGASKRDFPPSCRHDEGQGSSYSSGSDDDIFGDLMDDADDDDPFEHQFDGL